MHRNHSGFTLIELMIVIAIVAIIKVEEVTEVANRIGQQRDSFFEAASQKISRLQNSDPEDDRKFYILSLKHNTPTNNMLTWYRAKFSGYTWDLAAAGLYEEKEAKEAETLSMFEGMRRLVAVPRLMAELHISRVVEECNFDNLGIMRAEWNKARRS